MFWSSAAAWPTPSSQRAASTSASRSASMISSRRRARSRKRPRLPAAQIMLPVDALVAREFKAHPEHRVADVGDVAADEMILDAGPRSVAEVVQKLAGIKTLVWNGPFGAFELPPFDTATVTVAKAVAERVKAGQARRHRRRRRHGLGHEPCRHRRRSDLYLDRGRRLPGMDGRQAAAGRGSSAQGLIDQGTSRPRRALSPCPIRRRLRSRTIWPPSAATRPALRHRARARPAAGSASNRMHCRSSARAG